MTTGDSYDENSRNFQENLFKDDLNSENSILSKLIGTVVGTTGGIIFLTAAVTAIVIILIVCFCHKNCPFYRGRRRPGLFMYSPNSTTDSIEPPTEETVHHNIESSQSLGFANKESTNIDKGKVYNIIRSCNNIFINYCCLRDINH